MHYSHASLGAGIAGALLLIVPVLRMVLGVDAPSAADAIVGLFGFVLLAVSATAGATWPDGASRSGSYRATDCKASRADLFGERYGSARREARRASPAAR